MKQKKIVGMFIGKFLPPHFGHINQILECAKMCDKLFVVVADSTARSKRICKSANINTIFPKKRFLWMKHYFKNYKNIKVRFLNQGMLEAFPDEIENWKRKILKVTNHRATVWFVDKNFEDLSHKVFPEFIFIPFNRNKISVSATEIRNNPKLMQQYLIPEAKQYFNFFLKM